MQLNGLSNLRKKSRQSLPVVYGWRLLEQEALGSWYTQHAHTVGYTQRAHAHTVYTTRTYSIHNVHIQYYGCTPILLSSLLHRSHSTSLWWRTAADLSPFSRSQDGRQTLTRWRWSPAGISRSPEWNTAHNTTVDFNKLACAECSLGSWNKCCKYGKIPTSS